MNILLPLFRACHSTAGRLEYVLNQLEKSVKYGSKQVSFCYISSTFYELFNAFLIRSGTSYIQVLVLTPGVRVQVLDAVIISHKVSQKTDFVLCRPLSSSQKNIPQDRKNFDFGE